MSNPPIVVEHTYPTSVADLWKAITVRDRMVQWYFPQIPDFSPEVGGKTEFDVENEGIVYPHRWEVLEAVPEEKLVYDWQYEGIPGRGVVTWEVLEADDGAKLVLTCEGYETFPQDQEVFTKESCQAGWEYFLHESLADHLSR